MKYQPQVEPELYTQRGYDHRGRFISYWNQIDLVVRREPSSIVEIGIGSGFVARYLRSVGLDVHTVDFDERLEPDTVASVLDLPFEDNSFDLVCCFETLEHLPWEELAPALSELRRVAARWVLISLPDVTHYLRVRVERGWLRKHVDVFRDVPNRNPPVHEFNGEHYWEIGKAGYPIDRIRRAISDAGLSILEDYRDPENVYHRFFACERTA